MHTCLRREHGQFRKKGWWVVRNRMSTDGVGWNYMSQQKRSPRFSLPLRSAFKADGGG